jgi:hypothetical protein
LDSAALPQSRTSPSARQCRYGTEPKIAYFETVALTDKASGQASGLD